MSIQILDPFLVIVLLLNFYLLAATQLRTMTYAVSLQGALLGALYPVAHSALVHAEMSGRAALFDAVRLAALTIAIVVIKGFVIPRLLFRAMRQADIRWNVESLIGFLPTLLIGAVGTGLVLAFSQYLELKQDHSSTLVIPASLATLFTGFLILVTRKKAVTQVLGFVALENGIFIFGMLLIQAVPILVELGVVLDLFVGVFVMGIIIHHVNRAFPSASSEHLSVLKE